MSKSKNELLDRLSRYREIRIGVTGRKSGKTISLPVWFVLEGNKLFLLPVQGSDTQWYKNILHDRHIQITARDAAQDLVAVPLSDGDEVRHVVEKFKEKYGAADVKKYYSKFDVAVRIDL